MKNNNVEKELPAKGDLSEREELIKLASETAAEEKDLSDFMDMKYQMALFTPGKTLASLSSDEREKVNMLLRLTLGKKD